MDALHYSMVDPQMAPVDMLDVILPDDIYRMTYSYNEDELEEDDNEEKEEKTGVLATISKVFSSPIDWIVYLIEIWVDRHEKKSLYQPF